MNKTKIMETIGQNKLIPSFSDSFNNGWNVMKKYFLILFLVVIVVGIITAPTQIFRWNIDPSHHHNWNFHFPDAGLIALGIFTFIFGLFALAYAILIVPVFRYGGKMMFLQAVRDTRPDFNLIVNGFRENYLGIVLANLLTYALIMLGCIALVIPGIIIGCRLAFVGFLVMDKKLDPIMAVEESWKMTKGYGWTIFSMAIVSFFIFIAGLCVLIIGIFPASIWVSSSFASLYEAVSVARNAA
jgi:hypothetical protein